jgi:hypothetical protein
MATIVVTTESGTTYTIDEEHNSVVRARARRNSSVPDHYSQGLNPLYHISAHLGAPGYFHFGRYMHDWIQTTPVASITIDGEKADEYEYDIEVDV